MAIREEKRVDAPRPEVTETDYGAMFIKAAVETDASVEVKAEAGDEGDVKEAVEPKPAVKRKGGRPKKSAK